MRVFSVCAALIVGSVIAPAHGETLTEAFIEAYGSNPALQARRAQSRAQDEVVPQSLAGWRPTITAGASMGRGEYKSASAAGESKVGRSPRSTSMTVSETLYRGGTTVATTEQAESTVRADRAQLQETEQSVLLSTATAYLDVVRDQALVALNINNESLVRKQLEAAQERFTVGEITRTDVSQAEARLAGAKAARIKADGTLEGSRSTYERVVGVPPRDIVPPTHLTNLPQSLVEAVSVAKEDNTGVKVANSLYAASGHAVDVARGALRPNLSVRAGTVRSWQQASHNDANRQISMTLSGAVPLFQQGAEYSRLRQAKHVVGQRHLELKAAQRTAIDSAHETWEALQTARAQILSFKAQIVASEIALNGVERESQVGSRTILDVLNAQQELLAARANLVRAERDELAAEFNLANAIGRLTVQSLGVPVRPYDPGIHYEEVRDQWFGGNKQSDNDAMPSNMRIVN